MEGTTVGRKMLEASERRRRAAARHQHRSGRNAFRFIPACAVEQTEHA